MSPGVLLEVLLSGGVPVESASCAKATLRGESVNDAVSRTVRMLVAVEERHRHKENLADCIYKNDLHAPKYIARVKRVF